MKSLLKHFILLAALCFVTSSRAELQPDLKITGDKSGVVKGELVQKGKEGLWPVYAYNLEIQAPIDVASGLPTGRRSFKPLSLVVPAGPLHTPALHNLFATSESLKTVEIRFWSASLSGPGSGSESVYLTVRLTNARIVSLRDWVANIKDVDLVKFPQQHQIELTYEKIEWISPKASASDSATNPGA